jgi:hypothetical protein
MRTKTGGLVVASLTVAGLAGPAAAQDANYWTIQYGPVAQLLGGQVVGSTRDLSATYYNPGGLALAKQKGLERTWFEQTGGPHSIGFNT